jgi:hypothetical protein
MGRSRLVYRRLLCLRRLAIAKKPLLCCRLVCNRLATRVVQPHRLLQSYLGRVQVGGRLTDVRLPSLWATLWSGQPASRRCEPTPCLRSWNVRFAALKASREASDSAWPRPGRLVSVRLQHGRFQARLTSSTCRPITSCHVRLRSSPRRQPVSSAAMISRCRCGPACSSSKPCRGAWLARVESPEPRTQSRPRS